MRYETSGPHEVHRGGKYRRAGRCGPIIHQVFSLASAADAHRLMERGGHIGKIVLRVAD